MVIAIEKIHHPSKLHFFGKRYEKEKFLAFFENTITLERNRKKPTFFIVTFR